MLWQNTGGASCW